MADPTSKPAAPPEPEPYATRDSNDNFVCVSSPFDQPTVTLIADGAELTPDQADKTADALKAHAAARRFGSFIENAVARNG